MYCIVVQFCKAHLLPLAKLSVYFSSLVRFASSELLDQTHHLVVSLIVEQLGESLLDDVALVHHLSRSDPVKREAQKQVGIHQREEKTVQTRLQKREERRDSAEERREKIE